MKRSLLFAFTVLVLAVIAVGVALPLWMAQSSPQEAEVFDLAPVTATLTPFLPQTGGISNQAPVLTDTTQPDNDCTYTEYHWLANPGQWPGEINIAGMSINREEAARLFSVADPEPALLLTRTLYITTLNILKGSDYRLVETMLNEANEWLRNYPPGQPMSEFNRSIGLTLAAALADYNNGITGPGLCSGQVPTPTGRSATAEALPTGTPVLAPALPSATSRPYIPPTATEPQPKKRKRTPTPLPPTAPPVIPPTATPVTPAPTATPTATVLPPTPTRRPPTATPPPPTATSPPPTPTDPPPTATPLPTSTMRPTKDPKPTKPG